MKVICIKESDGMSLGRSGKWYDRRNNTIKFGEIYTVIDLIDSIRYPGEKSYVLAEFPENRSFSCRYFASLSDIDETEFERENIKVSSL